MSTIDEIMRAASTLGDQRLMATHNRATREDVLEAETAMRDLISAALADARRDGAAEAQQRMFPCCGGSDESPADHTMDCPDAPAGERQAVLLTDEAVTAACRDIAIAVAENCGSVPQLTHPHIYLGVRKLLATNGLEAHRD